MDSGDGETEKKRLLGAVSFLYSNIDFKYMVAYIIMITYAMGKGVAIAGKLIDKKMTFVSFLHKELDDEEAVIMKADKVIAAKS